MSSYTINSGFKDVVPTVKNDKFRAESDKIEHRLRKYTDETDYDPAFGAQRLSYHHVNRMEREQAIEALPNPSAKVPSLDFMYETFNKNRKRT